MKVYLDNSSTTFPKPKVVADSIYNHLMNVCGNANRGNYSSSLQNNRELLLARERIANLLHFDSISNVIFTNNITTSLNFLIKGIVCEGDHIISSTMEHNSILRPLFELKRNLNISLSLVQGSKEGFITSQDVICQMTNKTKIVVLSHASNVTGSIQPLKEIGAECMKRNITFIIDSAQSAGAIPVNFKDLNANAIAFTGHKSLLGPQGIGGFIIDDKTNEICKTLISGGTGSLSYSLDQPDFLPDKFESGTLNMPGIIGLSNSIDFINNIGVNTIKEKVQYLRKKLYHGINNINNFELYGDKTHLNSTTSLSLNFRNLDSSELSFYLEENNIQSRSGLHCAPLTHKSLNTFPAGTVRLSLSYFNTEKEIDYVLSVLNKFKK